MVCRKALGAWMLTAVVAWSCGSEPNDTAENSTAAGSSTDAPGGGTSAADATATNGVGTSAPGNATSGAGSDGSPTASTPTTGTAAPNDTSGAPTTSNTTPTGTPGASSDTPGDDVTPPNTDDGDATDDGSGSAGETPADSDPDVDAPADDGTVPGVMDGPEVTPVEGETTAIPAADLLARAGLGWNLGNSLDAPEGETSWGNPEVSETLIAAVADAGFELIRIPVSWSLYMGPAPDFTIDPAWLDRVEEVVGFVTSRGLLAVINLHHDGADGYDGVEWISLNDSSGAITAEHDAAVDAQFTRVWEQLSARFEAHGDLLLFEGMNEIHDGYDTPPTEYLVRINELNQLFVDVVRQSGGNNAQRALIVPGYNTNIDHTLAGFELPTDSATDKLALSVHFYDPWSFAGEASTNTWGAASPGSDSWGQEDFVVGQFDKLQAEYISQGIAVMMGEYGAVKNAGYENYRRYYMEYVTKAAVDRGIVPVYWDNGGMGTGPDSFGIFDRSAGTVAEPELLEAMFRAATMQYTLADIALP